MFKNLKILMMLKRSLNDENYLMKQLNKNKKIRILMKNHLLLNTQIVL